MLGQACSMADLKSKGGVDVIFGLHTRKEVESLKKELTDDFERKLLNKDNIIHQKEEIYQKMLDDQQNMIAHIKEISSSLKKAEKELKLKDESLNLINKERGRLLNTKSKRIKKKYIKIIDAKLEG